MFGVHRISKLLAAGEKEDYSQFVSQLYVLNNLKKEYVKKEANAFISNEWCYGCSEWKCKFL